MVLLDEEDNDDGVRGSMDEKLIISVGVLIPIFILVFFAFYLRVKHPEGDAKSVHYFGVLLSSLVLGVAILVVIITLLDYQGLGNKAIVMALITIELLIIGGILLLDSLSKLKGEKELITTKKGYIISLMTYINLIAIGIALLGVQVSLSDNQSSGVISLYNLRVPLGIGYLVASILLVPASIIGYLKWKKRIEEV